MMNRILLTLLILSSFCTFGQSNSQGVFTVLDIRSIISFDVTSTGNRLEYYFNNPNQITNGLVGNNIFKAQVKSNQNWIMNVHADTPFFLDASDNRPSSMPTSIIGLRKENKTDFVKVDVLPKAIATGPRGNEKKKDNNFMLDMEITPGDHAEPGEFYVNLVFTITPD